MSVSPKLISPTFMTPELIKPHLGYDGESHRLSVTDLWKISATHGTTIESAVTLLFKGTFERDYSVPVDEQGRRNYNKEFFATPNPKFCFDVDELEGNFDTDIFAGIDAVQAAIEYAESGDSNFDNGVVIAFSGKLSLEGAEISTDYSPSGIAYEAAKGVELVLPKAPGIETVSGIYPVDQQALEDLRSSILHAVQ